MNSLEAHLNAQDDPFAEFFWHRLRWKAVSDYLPKNQRFSLVDIGAGAGHFGTFLERNFPLAEYHFVEPLGSLESQLEGRFGRAGNVRRLRSYSGAKYITMLDVLEHQEDDTQFLEGVFAASEPGTTLIITVPALMTLWSDWDVSLGHYRRYDRPSLSDLLARFPVEVLEVSYLFPELVFAGYFRAWRSRRKQMTGDNRENFPNLPRGVNHALYELGRPGVAWRRRMPRGSSLIAAVRVPARPDRDVTTTPASETVPDDAGFVAEDPRLTGQDRGSDHAPLDLVLRWIQRLVPLAIGAPVVAGVLITVRHLAATRYPFLGWNGVIASDGKAFALGMTPYGNPHAGYTGMFYTPLYPMMLAPLYPRSGGTDGRLSSRCFQGSCSPQRPGVWRWALGRLVASIASVTSSAASGSADWRGGSSVPTQTTVCSMVVSIRRR